MERKIIFLVGMTGSGKSVVADELVGQGFTYLRLGQITMDKLQENGMEVNEANEKAIREGFRKEHGMGAFATLNIPKIDNFIQTSNVVVDGLYSWSEYKIFKAKYGEAMVVIAVYASPEIRYERLEKRTLEKDDSARRFRALTREQAQARDYAEIENIEKGGPIAMADFTIKNIGTIDELKKEITDVLSRIKQSND